LCKALKSSAVVLFLEATGLNVLRGIFVVMLIALKEKTKSTTSLHRIVPTRRR